MDGNEGWLLVVVITAALIAFGLVFLRYGTRKSKKDEGTSEWSNGQTYGTTVHLKFQDGTEIDIKCEFPPDDWSYEGNTFQAQWDSCGIVDISTNGNRTAAYDSDIGTVHIGYSGVSSYRIEE